MSSGYLLLKNNPEGNQDGLALAFMLVMTIVVVKKIYKSFACGDKEGCSCDTHSKKQP